MTAAAVVTVAAAAAVLAWAVETRIAAWLRPDAPEGDR